MPKSYRHLTSLFFGVPLALLPAKRDEILSFWNMKLDGLQIDTSQFALNERAQTEVVSTPGSSGGIAVVPLYGILAQHMGMMEAMSGGTSTEDFAQMMREAAADPNVRAIVMDINSPGGSTYGMTELADIIYSLRGSKPIIAQANSLMASAAYWIGSQADEIVATPGGDVGHIGVSSLHLDKSKAAEMEGLRPYLITAGKYKSEQSVGSDLVPPTSEALAHAQESVNEAYSRFTSSVARGRGISVNDVMNGMGQGRCLPASEAMKQGLVDRIGTLEQTITRLSRGGGPRRRFAQLNAPNNSQYLDMNNHAEGNMEDEFDIDLLNSEAIPAHDTGTAEMGTPWSTPTLADFTDQTWEELSAAEKMRIARHAVWSDTMPPEKFTDLGGFHHKPGRSGIGPAVWRAVASGRMEQASWSSDEGVRRHRANHYHQFGRKAPWENQGSLDGEEINSEESHDNTADNSNEEPTPVNNFSMQRWEHEKAEAIKAGLI